MSNKTSGKRKICLPVDGSEHSLRAADFFIDQVYREGDFVVIVTCVETPNLPLVSITSGANIPYDKWKEALEANITRINSLKEKYEAKFQKLGIPFTHLTMNASKPGAGIIQAGTEHEVTLFVMGSRGLGSIKRSFLGSVSDYVLHHATVPCIIVPPKD